MSINKLKLIKIGLISDSQYCDVENGHNFEKTKERFYRNSIYHIENAINHFSKSNCNYIIQLGDLIDGKCNSMQKTSEVLRLFETIFNKVSEDIEVFHVVGNHELYNLSRDEFNRSFLGSGLRRYQKEETIFNYFKVNLNEKLTLVVIDVYEICLINKSGDQSQDNNYTKAREILKGNNTNSNWNDPNNLKNRRFTAFNGGMSCRQIDWMRKQFEEAQKENKFVILAGHIPLIDVIDNPICQVWNYEDIVNTIHEFPCVKLYLCGHVHEVQLITPNDKYHFTQFTMPGIVESDMESKPYSILTIDENFNVSIEPMKGIWSKPIQLKF